MLAYPAHEWRARKQCLPGNSRRTLAVIGGLQQPGGAIPLVRGAWNSRWDDELLPRAAAIAGTLTLLALAGKLLLGPPRSVRAPVEDPSRVQLVFVPTPSAAGMPLPMPPPQQQVLPVVQEAAGVPAPRAPGVAANANASAAVRDVPRPVQAPGPVQLYGSDGRVQLPATDQWTATEATAKKSADDAAARLMEPPNPVDVRQTRFAKDWVSDGDVADVVQQQIARAQRKIAEFLLGGDIKHATARPSPEVRFNPARHERGADLGSEATGDAYKAAPINYQPAPGLDGEASRRIREQVAALETAYGRCDRARLEKLMQPLLLHLDELQKVEAAKAAGADPVRAEHMLPNSANAAYDMARRALWYADEKMAVACGG